MSSPNPFGGPNPFADPAVTVHTESTADDNNYAVRPTGETEWGSNASPWGATAVTSSPRNGTRQSTTEMALSKREAEIKQREEQLEQQRRDLQNQQRVQAASGTRPLKNWPPCAPILYHDIEAEIPVAMQSTVKRAYYTYLIFCVTVLFNFLCVTLAMVQGDSDLIGWIFSGIYALLGIPGAFLIWYGRLYNAAAYDRSVVFMCFFFGNAIHVGFCTWAAIAVPFLQRDSFAGFVEVFKKFDNSAWLGIFYLVSFILWTGCVILSIFVWQQAMREFRGRGGPQQVQNQMQAAAGRAVVQGVAVGRV